jgi:hypothetical protein
VSPNYLVGIDANNCPITNPTANYIAISLCNNCATPVNVGSISLIYASTPGAVLAGNQSATQDVGIIPAGACETYYYHVNYPCNPTNSDVPFTMTWQLNDGANTSNLTYNFTKRNLIDANAGGLVTSFVVSNANVIGGVSQLDCTFQFGNLPNTNSVLSFHPLSDPQFNSGCFQLVSSEVISTTAPTCIPLGYKFMSYVPPGGNGVQCDNASITVRYRFKSKCINVSSSLLPMSYATIGGQIKKRVGTTGNVSITFANGNISPSITNSPNVNSASPGDTVLYSVKICNPSISDTISIAQITASLPSGWTYEGIAPLSEITNAELASTPLIGSTGTLSFNGGLLVTPNFRSIIMPPNSCRTLIYKVAIPTSFNNFGTFTNAANFSVEDFVSASANAMVSVSLPLPLQLTSFAAHNRECGAFLEWSTQNEQNFSHFIIEKLNPLGVFEPYSFVNSKGAVKV